jgi:bifunctional UDP-N-acetylglucosamine pyrophosphorylase/glucosamine-1-phosphate N-acetyltransferase
MGFAIIILAAGIGKRMKSHRPKVLHEVCGKPMIYYILREVEKLKPDQIIVVVGHKAEEVKAAVGNRASYVLQEKQLGTGHAVMVTQKELADFKGFILILNGDSPLVRAPTLKAMYDRCKEEQATVAVLTAILPDPKGYGRIIRDEAGRVAKIVEEKDATAEQKTIQEINAGIYCFKKEELFEALKKVTPQNKQSEYYLTDVVELLRKKGGKITSLTIDDPEEILGVNSRDQLALVNRIMRQRINEELMNEGVTLLEPELTFIGPEVKVGKDTVIYPLTFIEGTTTIGEGCIIGPSSRIVNSIIGNNVKLQYAVVIESVIEDEATIGPYAHLRPGTQISRKAKVGSFVEVKKSQVGEGSKVPHLSYIGDATIGKGVNIGAGTITCNYNGFRKYKTVIEDGAFIGSDTMLVAPVKIGKGAVTGAGSTITKDVPDDSLAVERSSQNIVKGWAAQKRSQWQEKKKKEQQEGREDG